MCQMRDVVKALLRELGMSQVELCDLLNQREKRLNLYPSELSKYLLGQRLGTKGRHVLELATEVLTSEKKRRNELIQAAQAVLNQ